MSSPEKNLDAGSALDQPRTVLQACLAVAVASLEGDLLQKQRARLSAEDEIVFMLTWECFVLWAIKHGLEDTLEPRDVDVAVLVLRSFFAKCPWHREEPFAKIWEQMQVVMPMALEPDSVSEGGYYPATDMLLAANQAGYHLDYSISADLEFGVYVGQILRDLLVFGREVADEGPKSS